MLSGLFKAFAQLPETRLRGILIRGVLGAAAIYAALVAVVWTVASNVTWFSDAWLDVGTGIALVVLSLVVPLLFFPALATAIMGPMLDGAAQAVEDRHYPGLPAPRDQKLAEILWTTLRFVLIMVGVNLLALPVYAVLLLTGLTFILVTLINGYLLGREYYELVALRRLEDTPARLLFRNNLGRLWLTGAMISVMFSIPVLNLAAPVLGTAFMVHVFQSLPRA